MSARLGIGAVASEVTRARTFWPIIAITLAVGCTNDYEQLDFSGISLDGAITSDAGGSGGDASASGGGGAAMGGSPATGGSGGASGGAGGNVADANTGGSGGASGTAGDASSGGSGGMLPEGGSTGGASMEAGPVDAGAASCDQLYGTANGYISCSSDAVSCTFYATTQNDSCDTLCTGLGGTCIDANDNSIPPGQECNASNTSFTCATTNYDQICTCSR